jgi:GNAT superfamily N-acetyltransferase
VRAYRIRRARREDVPAIVRMLADDQLGAGRESASPDDAAYLAAFEAIDADPAQLLLVAEAVGSELPVATLQLTFIPGLARRGAWRAQIEAVRVAASERGSGLGSEMVRYAIAEARDRGCALVQLTSDRRRTRAHEFYRRLGFEETHVGMKLKL